MKKEKRKRRDEKPLTPGQEWMRKLEWALKDNPLSPFAVIIFVWGVGILFANFATPNATAMLECLFTGLAFAGLVLTLWYQRKEMRMQRKEMTLQRISLRKSARALRQAAYLDALGIYMNNLCAPIDEQHPNKDKHEKLLNEAHTMLRRFRSDVLKEYTEEIGEEVDVRFRALVMLVNAEYSRRGGKTGRDRRINSLQKVLDRAKLQIENEGLSQIELNLWYHMYDVVNDSLHIFAKSPASIVGRAAIR